MVPGPHHRGETANPRRPACHWHRPITGLRCLGPGPPARGSRRRQLRVRMPPSRVRKPLPKVSLERPRHDAPATPRQTRHAPGRNVAAWTLQPTPENHRPMGRLHQYQTAEHHRRNRLTCQRHRNDVTPPDEPGNALSSPSAPPHPWPPAPTLTDFCPQTSAAESRRQSRSGSSTPVTVLSSPSSPNASGVNFTWTSRALSCWASRKLSTAHAASRCAMVPGEAPLMPVGLRGSWCPRGRTPHRRFLCPGDWNGCIRAARRGFRLRLDRHVICAEAGTPLAVLKPLRVHGNPSAASV